jgi:hypothetical protein
MFELLRQTVRSELAAMSTHFRDCQLFEEICEIDFREDLQKGLAPVQIAGVGCGDRIRRNEVIRQNDQHELKPGGRFTTFTSRDKSTTGKRL